MFINEMDEKVFTTGGSCHFGSGTDDALLVRLFAIVGALGVRPSEGDVLTIASKADTVKGGRSSLQPFSAGRLKIVQKSQEFIGPHSDQAAFFGIESAKTG